MKKAITTSAILLAATLAYATVTGDYNTWFGYLAGEDASGNRATVFGAGAGGGAQDIYRTDLIGAAAGVYGYRFHDSVGIGYRALRYSSDVTNTVAIGSHALEGVNMGGITDATWINGHFVANPPKYNGSWWQQTPGEFYITGDATLTNNLAPIWYDGTNLHLRGYSPGASSSGGTNATMSVDALKSLMAAAGMDYADSDGDVWTAELRVKLWDQNSQLDPTSADTILYFTETTFGGLRAWTNETSTAIFLYATNGVYYAADKGSLNASDPLDTTTICYTGKLAAGVKFSMWTPNVTTFEYVRYRKRDEVIYKSTLRQALIDLGVTVTQ